MIAIHVFFCHTEMQARRISDIIQASSGFDRYILFTSCKYSVCDTAERSDRLSFTHDVKEIPIVWNKDGSISVDFLYDELEKETCGKSGTCIEVDITNARPDESFAVCWVSAAIDIRVCMDKQKDGKKDRVRLGSVPPFSAMSDIEVDVIDHFCTEKKFGNADVNEFINGDVNMTYARRVTKSLSKRDFLHVFTDRNRSAGRDCNMYEVTETGNYMAGMNRRSINEKIAPSKN